MKKILFKILMKCIDYLEYIYDKWNKIKLLSTSDYKHLFAKLFEEKDKYIEKNNCKFDNTTHPIINKILFLLASIFGIEEDLVLETEKQESFFANYQNLNLNTDKFILSFNIFIAFFLLVYYYFMVHT